ncbi:FAD:protein FMN transferase [Pseudooceanicola sediminis]|uniref:FAD:protein FMN transferase n=1 Tax=Pseudooceanicola sediminis TaxID=2211117 RepID=A0A399J4F6_9RHOB|nr:FAD:protein FMN transferase [Pseudooceanicola sediminis]KAA2315486.1 FAD:protein FMN transferase [Puniceibacterium sp. HSS470]RII40308.1 FAD:protein FMN transferase [Pseudooceanicola sediminis]|tara:strand:- start:122912 stop:123895 length:984 start_codon:yes stop_codon:yes gene_type:complete
MTGPRHILIEPGAPGDMAGPGWRRITARGTSMGTGWHLIAWTAPGLPDPAPLVAAACAETVALFSPWAADSALSRFNTAPPGWHRLPGPLMALLRDSLRICDLTGGALDPTLGRLADLWGFGPSGPVAAAPDATELRDARAASGRARLRIEGDHAFQPGGLWLDFGGIAKGWAVERAAQHLVAAGLRVHMVEIGGEVAARGLSPDGQPWWIDIEAPPTCRDDATRHLAALHGMALAGSGHWRRRAGPGAGWSHTLDPVTGQPGGGAVLSAHVFHRRAALADAWATALMVLPPQQGLALARAQDLPALLTLPDGARVGTCLQEWEDAA